METKKFHIGDVLSITTSYLVSPHHMDGVYDILSFMTGNELSTFQLLRASDECKPCLLEQFPQLDTPEIKLAVGELIKMFKTPSGEKERKKLLLGWFSKLISGKYGVKCEEMLKVKPLPKNAHVVRNPIKEAGELMGDPKKVIVVFTD